MNYRHAFHAGNFADIFKHIILTRLVLALQRKDTAFRVIDTHAGAGLYDLAGDEARRSPEWRDGVARFDHARMSPDVEALAQPFRALLDSFRGEHGPSAYPGSPLIVRHLLRAQDKFIASEAHGETADALRRSLGRDQRVKILAQDGFMTLRATIPPPERRGLALIDPAFESPDEFSATAAALIAAWRKWPTGIYAVWHPVKDITIVERFMQTIQKAGVEKVLRAEIQVTSPGERGLGACGLLIVNPPFMLAGELAVLLPELARILARGVARWRCDWLAPERAGVASHSPRPGPGASRE